MGLVWIYSSQRSFSFSEKQQREKEEGEALVPHGSRMSAAARELAAKFHREFAGTGLEVKLLSSGPTAGDVAAKGLLKG